MTESVVETGILERIPHGYMQLKGDRIVAMNRSLRSLFGDRFDKLSVLVQEFPEVGFLSPSPAEGPVTRWIDLGGALFSVSLIKAEDSLIACFLPAHYLAEMDPELQALQQAYDDFVEIFQNCFDGIYVADGSGKTLWINDGFERCYGLSARNFIGRNASELERLGYVKPLITWKVITTRQRQTALQTTKSGKKILATGIPLLDKQGQVRKVIINSRDTTELVALKERLESAEKEIERYESELIRLRKEAVPGGDLIWNSDQMNELVEMVLHVAKFDTTLLITGESGVGKEVVANLVHRNSNRKDGPFMQINCGAIPGELLESELFGYEEGAFTGSRQRGKKGLLELADGGTLFLDEIGEMPVGLQVKLLRVLQDQRFTRVGGVKTIQTDFRILAATNRDLKERVAEGEFREDLFYRLSVVPIEVPPLRARPEDIIGLSYHFLEFFNAKYGLSKKLSPEAMDRLVQHTWPGNVRELRNLIERVMVVSPEEEIGASRLPLEPASLVSVEKSDGGVALSSEDLKVQVAQFEAELLTQAIAQHGSIRKTAEATGISESTIKRKLKPARR